MAETSDLRVIAQIGQGYVGLSDQFLTEQLGRAYTLAEMVQFAETSVSMMLASAYASFREHVGKEQAEAWLKKTLNVSASTIRLLGADALVRFDVTIKDMPNKLHQRRQEMQQAPTTPQEATPPKCTCKLAQDGSCASCVTTLAGIFKGTFQVMHQMAESGRVAQEMCQVCHANQTDRALATIIPDALSLQVPPDKKEAFQQEILAILHQIAGAHGATAIPLTEKAWKDAVKV